MKFLKELTQNILIEEDNSEIPEKSIKELQSLIRKGAETHTEWPNALALIHKAYEVSNIQRPTPSMIKAWAQYEKLISYAVDQLSKTQGQHGTWRTTSESKCHLIELYNGSELVSSDISYSSMDDIKEEFSFAYDNMILKNVQNLTESKLELWEYGTIKSKVHMIITELFDDVLPYTETAPDRFSFNVDDIQYDVNFVERDLPKSTQIKIDDIVNVRGIDIEFSIRNPTTGRASMNITNTGNAIKVFSTVLDIIKKFIKSQYVEYIMFSAEEPSRQKLYDRLTKLIVRQTSYELYHTFDNNYGKNYILKSSIDTN